MRIDTSTLDASGSTLSEEIQHQVYCALDSMLTLEILSAIKKEHPGCGEPIYQFERELQAPLLEISLRGFRVDGLARHQAEQALRKELLETEALLNQLAEAAWNRPLNANSPKQLGELFYETMHIPPVMLSFKGERRVSTNREALEKIEEYMYARPLVTLILACRDLTKKLSVLTQEIDPDGRFRTSYNIGGTETGRLSSSTSVLGTGGNAQNITGDIRYVFIADQGCRLASIDLEQVEARDTGFLCGVLFGDWTLLDNCESGDFHTNNCRLVWPNLGWTGSGPADRKIAEAKRVYRDWTYRDLMKRGGHLTNYMGTAWTMSRVLKLPLPVCEEFQARYCKGGAFPPAYPTLPRYWQWIAERLQTDRFLVTPFGRRRDFFGRPGDDATLREAIAFIPQSMTADRTNLWLWRVWKKMPSVQLLAQTHDSITFQFPEDADEDEVIQEALELLRVPLVDPRSGRQYIAPGEAKVGWNWGNIWTEEDNRQAVKKGLPSRPLNLGGLRKWKLGQRDERVRPSGLERLGVGK